MLKALILIILEEMVNIILEFPFCALAVSIQILNTPILLQVNEQITIISIILYIVNNDSRVCYVLVKYK